MQTNAEKWKYKVIGNKRRDPLQTLKSMERENISTCH